MYVAYSLFDRLLFNMPHCYWVNCLMKLLTKDIDSLVMNTKEYEMYGMGEHVAQQIGCWTQDQKVWGLIPTAGHV